MNVALWIVQVLLALVFLMSGGMKLMPPKEKVVENTGVMEKFSENQIKIIGGLEVLGAIGIILPWLVNVANVLTPLAGIGLTLVMVVAAYNHYQRGEMPNIGFNAVLLLLALFVTIGRF